MDCRNALRSRAGRAVHPRPGRRPRGCERPRGVRQQDGHRRHPQVAVGRLYSTLAEADRGDGPAAQKADVLWEKIRKGWKTRGGSAPASRGFRLQAEGDEGIHDDRRDRRIRGEAHSREPRFDRDRCACGRCAPPDAWRRTTFVRVFQIHVDAPPASLPTRLSQASSESSAVPRLRCRRRAVRAAAALAGGCRSPASRSQIFRPSPEHRSPRPAPRSRRWSCRDRRDPGGSA